MYKKRMTFIMEDNLTSFEKYTFNKILDSLGINLTHVNFIINEDTGIIIPMDIKSCLSIGLEKPVLSNIRGSIYNIDDNYVMPTLSLSNINKVWLNKSIISLDIAKAYNFINGKCPLESIEVEKLYTLDSALLMMNMYYGKTVALDLETKWGSADIKCIGLSTGKESTISISLDLFSQNDIIELYYNLEKLCTDKGTRLVMHNAMFDMGVLKLNGIECTNIWMDTMLAFHLLYAEFPKSLSFVQSIYLNIPYHKDQSKNDLLWYNGMDTGVTYLFVEHIMKELEEMELTDVYFNQVHKLIFPLLNMQSIPIDKGMMEVVIADTTEKLKIEQDKLDSRVGYSLNVNGKKLKNYFYDDLGLTVIRDRNTDNLALMELSKKYPLFIPLFEQVKDIRHYRKLLSSYLDLKYIVNGCIHTTYNIAGTTSGRLSASAPLYYEGLNIMTIPKELRKMYISPEGYSYVGGDLSQAELRIVAYISNEEKLIDKLNTDEDIFIWIASLIFNSQSITDEQRNLAKKIVHATNYGMGDHVCSLYTGLSIFQAKGLKEKYFLTFPKIKIWQNKIIIEVNKTLMLKTIFGRKRYFYDRINNEEVLSYLPQSIASDVCLKALIDIYEWTQSQVDITPKIEIHDAIVLLCKDEDTEKVSMKLSEVLSQTLDFPSGKCFMKNKVKIGKSWYAVS